MQETCCTDSRAAFYLCYISKAKLKLVLLLSEYIPYAIDSKGTDKEQRAKSKEHAMQSQLAAVKWPATTTTSELLHACCQLAATSLHRPMHVHVMSQIADDDALAQQHARARPIDEKVLRTTSVRRCQLSFMQGPGDVRFGFLSQNVLYLTNSIYRIDYKHLGNDFYNTKYIFFEKKRGYNITTSVFVYLSPNFYCSNFDHTFFSAKDFQIHQVFTYMIFY